MALSTKGQQLAMLNFGLPWWTTLPEPDVVIDRGEMLHFLHLSSAALAVLPGPYRVTAGETHTPGAVIGELHHPGSAAGETFTPGSVIGETSA